jgi:hypothetical protein
MLYFDRREIDNWLLQNPTTIDETEPEAIEDSSSSSKKGGAK